MTLEIQRITNYSSNSTTSRSPGISTHKEIKMICLFQVYRRYDRPSFLNRYFVVLLMLLFLAGCGGNDNATDSLLPADDSETLMVQTLPTWPIWPDAPDIVPGFDERVKHVLFAHGYSDDVSAWDSYKKFISDNEDYASVWHPLTFDVPSNESIETRANVLAESMVDLDDVEDDTLIAVGHSMGGLDLRYIISEGHKNQGDTNNKFYLAAKKIHKLYTIASPHGGNMSGGIPKDPGAVSLGIKQMRQFNIDNPYHQSNIDGRDIPMLALRFRCGEKKSSDGTGAIEPEGDDDGDGTVAVKRQILFGAPFTQTIFHGRHTDNPPNMCSTNALELTQDTVVKGILDNVNYYTDVKDIVFYEHLNCEGDEKGAFSSQHKNEDVFCKDDNICDNDEFSSMKIYPGVRRNTVVKLYDNSGMSRSDDWTRIHIGSVEFEEPFCVNGFEHNTSDREADQGITVIHHPMNGLNGKVSALKVISSNQKFDPTDIVFYENKGCTGNIVGVFQSSKNYSTNCKKSDLCKNDEASSVMIYPGVNTDAEIYLYNDPDADDSKDWARIDLTGLEIDEPYCVTQFEHTYTSNNGLDVEYHDTQTVGINADLNGNVSRIEINH